MAQKTNPISLRSSSYFQNLDFFNQVFHEKFLAYSFDEQEKLLFFIKNFLLHFAIITCNITIAKNPKGNFFFHIRYVFLGLKKKKKSYLKFSCFEEAFLSGLNKLGVARSVVVVFFHINSNETQSSLIPAFLKQNIFFAQIEILSILKTFFLAKGFAFFLCELFALKIESFKSKTQKKFQARIFLFFEKLFLFLKKQNSVRFKGLRFLMKGRINGIARAKKMVFFFGNLNLQKFSNQIDFSYKQIRTIFGSLGIKVWINYE